MAGVGIALILWRYAVGLGAATGMSDGYPFGLWIAFDVVTGTALACGGYAMALIVYVLNKGRYHPLVRPAILTSALGYTIAGLSVLIDVGRPWLVWKLPLFPGRWNASSVMLEVALCVMSYVAVLWLELAPAFLERFRDSGHAGLRWLANRSRPLLDRSLPLIIALGLLLPTMHQSSLGSLMLLAETKLPPLWNQPALPVLFLVSCIAMGYAVVVLESSLAALAFRRPPETRMLESLFGAAVAASGIWLVIRFVDLGVRGHLGDAFALTADAALFWAEILLLLVPVGIWASRGARRRIGWLFRAAVLLALSGSLYRFNVYLVAFDPGPGWVYFPAVPELLITVGLVAAEIVAYVAAVRYFPILVGVRPEPASAAA
jgi:Ni/Fe-hydrogenase subunit HybB-like protein